MRRMTGGRAIVEALRIEGIERVFGIVGTHNAALFDGLFDEPALRLTTPRHEQGAALMASGYARASGKLAACFVVPGPGLTNALTGLGMAYSESAPVLVVTGQNPLATLDRERDLFHELPDSLQVAASVSGFVARCGRAADAPGLVREAVRSMRGRRPRPAVLEVPMDVLAEQAEVALLPPTSYSRPAPDPAELSRALALMEQARRPLLLAGGGVVSAEGGGPLRQLAERLGAPVISSAYAKGVIAEDHPLALGDGWGRRPELYAEVVEQADLAVAVGYKFDYITDATHGAGLRGKLIQIDLDPTVIGRHREPDVGLLADAALTLAALVGSLPLQQPSCWLDVEQFRRRKRERLAAQAGPLVPLFDDLRAVLPREAIVVDDLTLVAYWAPLLLPVYEPRGLLHAGTFGTLGSALPVAIGARLACPERPVVAIVGDGGFLFSVQELATAVAERLDLVVLLFDDAGFGALRTFQDRTLGGRRFAADLVNPDFQKLAEAFGVQGRRVKPDEVGSAVSQALAAGGVWLIEVPFDPPAPGSIPPWIAL